MLIMKKSVFPEKNRLLLVDDDPTLLSLLKDYLEINAYQVRTVKNGQEALQELEKDLPDVIICDVMMPDVDGYDFVAKLRARQDIGWIPVVFLSALGQIEDRIKGLNLGANVYMIKPIEPEELLAQVESLLNQSSRIQEHVDSSDTVNANLSFHFTPSETKVLQLVVQGLINRDIAPRLNIHKRTVETHIYNILGKTGFKNRTELMLWAIKNNI
jgi:DNA-binding NarL/FixJ family response regulator